MINKDDVTKLNISKEVEEKKLKAFLFKEVYTQLYKAGSETLIKNKRIINSEKEMFIFKSQKEFIENVLDIFIKIIRPVIMTNQYPQILLYNTQTLKTIDEIDVSPRLWLELTTNLLHNKLEIFEQCANEKIFNIKNLCKKSDYLIIKNVLNQDFLDDLHRQMFKAIEDAVNIAKLKLPKMVNHYQNKQDDDFLRSSAMVSFKDIQKFDQIKQKEKIENEDQNQDGKESIDVISSVKISKIAPKCKKQNREIFEYYQSVRKTMEFGFERLINILRIQPSNLNFEKYKQIDSFIKNYVSIERSGVDELNNNIFVVKLINVDKNNCMQILAQLKDNLHSALNLHKGEINFCELFK